MIAVYDGLSCEAASLLVTNTPYGSHLLRKSTTFEKQLVLSFNYHGRAQHIRLSMENDRHCCFNTSNEILMLYLVISLNFMQSRR